MKLRQILPVAAIVAIASLSLASCKSGNNNSTNGENAGNATPTEQTTTTATPAKSADEVALETAKSFKGWITAIEGDVVTIKNEANEELKVKIANAGDELIEGALIEVKYVDAEDGSKKTATDNEKSVSLTQNFKKLLGKWATEGDKITFELRKSGKVKTTMPSTKFKSWRIKDEKTIEFEIANDKGVMFSPWTVETIDDTNLILVNGEAKIPMTRKDSNRE
ncbi:MAG: hypothetical protein IKQ46_15640 [Bacteroidales bacterium]|jgi:hypothetical protein|nr:hypothetical protein [Bacteroidales bacterium]